MIRVRKTVGIFVWILVLFSLLGEVIVHASQEQVYLDGQWQYADHSKINSGYAVLYRAEGDSKKGYVVGVNAGHGTQGGTDVYTLCHPDGSAKVTGGTTAEGAVSTYAVSYGMTMADGTAEAEVVLAVAKALKDKLLAAGFDVLMLRDGSDVQLDNVARTVMCNQLADCHLSIHFDGDNLEYDKGYFYCSVPDPLKEMYPVSDVWKSSELLGETLVKKLGEGGFSIYGAGHVDLDLTQTSYSTIPSVDIELGNQYSTISDDKIEAYAEALFQGIMDYVISDVTVIK